MATESNPAVPDEGAGAQAPFWAAGPPPDWWPAGQPWPPPLPAGATYGSQPGQINYGQGPSDYRPPPIANGAPLAGSGLPNAPAAAPAATTGTGTAAGLTSPTNSAIGPFTEPFTAPKNINLGGPPGLEFIPPTPEFTPPGYTPPPAFKLPTAADAANDPGYQFTLSQGEQALGNSAAARGVANTGGTAKDFINYGQAAGTTQYQNVLDRQLNEYNTNYKTQYTDPYSFAFNNAAAAFAPKLTGYQTMAAAGQRANEDQFNNQFNKWLQDYVIRRGNNADAITLTTA